MGRKVSDMRPKTLTALFLATLCLAPDLAHAQKPPIEVRITFHDDPGAALKSDGQGASYGLLPSEYQSVYVRNQAVYYAVINANNGDLALNLKNSTRHLWMDLSSRVLPDPCPAVDPNGVNTPFFGGPYPTRLIFQVVNILRFSNVGDTGLTGAAIGLFDVRLSAWEPWSNNGCSGHVQVTRTGPKTWDIRAPGTIFGADGLAVVNQNFSTKPNGSDIRAVRYVNFPFHITVTALR
jgi:hypothetical protein